MPTEQELKKAYEELPTHLKKLISSTEIANDIKSIGKRNGLDDVNVELLLNEIGLVMLGLEDKERFFENLVTVLGLNEAVARKTSAQIQASVFSKMNTSSHASVEPPKENPSLLKQKIEGTPQRTPAQNTSLNNTPQEVAPPVREVPQRPPRQPQPQPQKQEQPKEQPKETDTTENLKNALTKESVSIRDLLNGA